MKASAVLLITALCEYDDLVAQAIHGVPRWSRARFSDAATVVGRRDRLEAEEAQCCTLPGGPWLGFGARDDLTKAQKVSCAHHADFLVA